MYKPLTEAEWEMEFNVERKPELDDDYEDDEDDGLPEYDDYGDGNDE